MSWTWLSHLGGLGLTPSQSTETLPATQLRRKGRKKNRTDRTPSQMVKAKLTDKITQRNIHKHTHTHKNKTNKQHQKTNRQNPRTNGKSKLKQTTSHKETYTHTLRREKRKKK